ncbi:MAG: hypothetical protein V4737_09570, partial [Curtobacterium sp.]
QSRAMQAAKRAAWESSPDGVAIAAWAERAARFSAAYLARETEWDATFRQDVDSAVPDEERAAFVSREYSPVPKVERLSQRLFLAGVALLLLDLLAVLVTWMASWGGNHFGIGFPVIAASAGIAIVLIIVGLFTGDRRWQARNRLDHEEGVARRSAKFGFDPLSEPKRRPAWHTGERPELAELKAAATTAHDEMWSSRRLPAIPEPGITSLEHSQSLPGCAALLQRWRHEPLTP